MKVAVTGASGLVGSALVPVLRDAGHDVLTLTRRAPEGDAQVAWDPEAGTIDTAGLEGVEAIVHLAGENIGRRWSGGTRKTHRLERVEGTGLIARTAAALESRPALVQASAVGYYGFDNPTATEASPKGEWVRRRRRAKRGSGRPSPAREAGLRWVALRKAPTPRARGRCRRGDDAPVQARCRRARGKRPSVVELVGARRCGTGLPARARIRPRRARQRRRGHGDERGVRQGVRARPPPADDRSRCPPSP